MNEKEKLEKFQAGTTVTEVHTKEKDFRLYVKRDANGNIVSVREQKSLFGIF